jgi:hypothetical protein
MNVNWIITALVIVQYLCYSVHAGCAGNRRVESPWAGHGISSRLYVIFFRYNSTVLFICNLSNIIFYIYVLFLIYVYIYKKYPFTIQYNALF